MSAKTILPATVPSHSPIHHARSRTTAHLQLVKPTQDADYKRNLLQHQIGAQAEEHRLRRDMEEARLNRKRLTNLETTHRPRLIEKMDSFIDRCIELVDRHVVVMILGSLLVLCGRGFSQDYSCQKLPDSLYDVRLCTNSDGSLVLDTFDSGGNESHFHFEFPNRAAMTAFACETVQKIDDGHARDPHHEDGIEFIRTSWVYRECAGADAKKIRVAACTRWVKAHKTLPLLCTPEGDQQ